MENKKSIIIVSLIAVLLIGIIVIFRLNSIKIKNINFNQISSTLENADMSVLVVGQVNEDIKKQMKMFSEEYEVSLLSTSETLENVNNYLKNFNLEIKEIPAFILYDEDTPIGIMEGNESTERYKELLDKFLYNKIPESERAYKIISDSEEYIKKVNSKKYTVAVFGYEGCSYCTLYLPVINKIAQEKNIDIYYFDRDNYDTYEWNNIMELDLKIPGECTLDGKDTTFLEGFPKPMTIITKSGKVKGCIRGYVTEDIVMAKLKEFNLIKEEK